MTSESSEKSAYWRGGLHWPVLCGHPFTWPLSAGLYSCHSWKSNNTNFRMNFEVKVSVPMNLLTDNSTGLVSLINSDTLLYKWKPGTSVVYIVFTYQLVQVVLSSSTQWNWMKQSCCCLWIEFSTLICVSMLISSIYAVFSYLTWMLFFRRLRLFSNV